ncbi:hypothetical protein MFUM_690072 [Methylacidiphilum fumariolicum SolV]|uniref:Uncharacterized protein n=3 Tax=Candidatus Methylacidiphilum fumarolicum TaxID=591154 RepID=I0JYV5_METFB|nr:conserved protein of unknown function [Candidatus Methylacidiphilum fumarolicum]CCG92424.1 hypothetical protein MFUM_690072 [Methylacidiphilum fumariolicum SolV]
MLRKLQSKQMNFATFFIFPSLDLDWGSLNIGSQQEKNKKAIHLSFLNEYLSILLFILNLPKS